MTPRNRLLKMKLSVIICTYNRSELLAYCLDSLYEQFFDSGAIEVIVVDNNSNDKTQEVINKFSAHGVRNIIETNQGLSHARNRGAAEAKGDWLLYLDDDILRDVGMLDRCLKWCDESKIVAFGGAFSPWYHYGEPHWFKKEYASINLKYDRVTELKGEEFLTGCVFALRKDGLNEVGGFDQNLGMRGNVVGYGEETEVQRLLRQKGHNIIFDPAIHVRHVVNPERLDPMWYLHSGWALGRDQVLAGKSKGGTLYLIFVLITAVLLLVFTGAINGVKLIFSKNYYPENLVIDSFRKLMKRAAIIYFNVIPSKR